MSQSQADWPPISTGSSPADRTLSLRPLLYLSRTLILIAYLLPMLVTPAVAAIGASGGKSAFIEADEDHILSPDDAFKLSVERIDEKILHADFKIAPGHYLYRDRFKFELVPADQASLSTALPQGEPKQDPTFGATEVFHDHVTATITLTSEGELPAHLKLQATYQGCSEKGLCYAPIRKILEIPANGAVSTAEAAASMSLAENEEDHAARLLKDGDLWLVVAGFFGFGLLLSLTPCVLPMIPILSSIVVGANPRSKWHSFSLSLSYVLGMAVAYSLAGIAAAFSGQLLSSTLQTPAVIIVTAVIFLLLALSMFGFYELKLPVSFEDRMLRLSSRFKGGQAIGVFVMGAVSALIVSPCVAAPLAGALLYISQTHDVMLGGTALFALSIGMGVPLLLIGTSAGSLLPRTGAWMTSVRNLFGVLLIDVSIWLITPLIPVPVQLGLWAALLIVPAIYMRATERLPENASGWQKLNKGIGLILLLLGIAMLVGALSGARSPLQPLSGFQAGSTSTAHPSALAFQHVKSIADLEHRIATAQGKPIMLDFYADWCVACKEMEQFTFSDPRVQARLAGFVLLQADVTANDADDRALLQRFGLFGPPGIIFFDRAGKEDRAVRVIGYQNADRFLSNINRLER